MLPAKDPADALTAPLVCYESSSDDEGAQVGDQPFARYKDSALGSRTEAEPSWSICSDDATVQAYHTAQCTLDRPSLSDPMTSLHDIAFQGPKNTASLVTIHLPLPVSSPSQQAKPGSSDWQSSEGNDASLTAKASNCLQPAEPPPAAVMDTNRTTHVASHDPSDPAAATSDVDAPSRMTHPTELEGYSTIADMQTDQSTHGSAKPAMGLRVESQSAAGFVAVDNATAAVPAQTTASAAHHVTQAYTDAVLHHPVTGAATDTVLSVTNPDTASQPRAGATVPCAVPGSVMEAPVASYTADPSVGTALSGTPAGTVTDSKGGAMADAQAEPPVDCEAAPEAEAMAQGTADDNLDQVPDAMQGSKEHAEAVSEAGTTAAFEAATAQRDMEAAAADAPGQLAAHLPLSAASETTPVPASNFSKAADAAVLPMAASQAADSEASQPVSSLHTQLPDARSAEAQANLPAKKVFKPPTGWTATAGGVVQSRRRSATSTAVEAKADKAVDPLLQGPHMGSSDAVVGTAEAVPTAVATSTCRQTCGRRTAKAPATAPVTAPATAPATALATSPATASATAPVAGGGKDLVSSRIEIWWSKDKAFYPGVVKSYNHRKKTHLVVYNDGERFPEDLRQKRHKLPDVSTDVINPDAPSDSDSDAGASSQQEAEDWQLLPANKPPASGRQQDKQPASQSPVPRKIESGALVARAATKARPPTPSRAAAARHVHATAQEAGEGSVSNAKAPVTYSRKKSPAASEAAAAAAVTGGAAHKIVPAGGSSKRKSSVTRPASSKTQEPSAVSQSTANRRQSRASAATGLQSGAVATGPGPEAAGSDPVHRAVATGPDAGAAAATGPDAGAVAAAAAAGTGAVANIDPHRGSINQAEFQTDQQPARPKTGLLAHESMDQQMSNDSVQQLFHGQPYGQAQLPGLLPGHLPLVVPPGHGLPAGISVQHHPIWNAISSSAGLFIVPSQPAQAAVSPQPGLVFNPSDTLAPQSQQHVIPGTHSQLPNQISHTDSAQSPPAMHDFLLAPQSTSFSLVPQQADQPNPQLPVPSPRLHSSLQPRGQTQRDHLSPQLHAQALSRDQPSPQLFDLCPAGDQPSHELLSQPSPRARPSPKEASPTIAPASAKRVLKHKSESNTQSVAMAKALDVSMWRAETEQSGAGLPVNGQHLCSEGQELSAERQVTVGLPTQAPPAQTAKAEKEFLKAKRGMMNTRSVRGNKAQDLANLQPAHGLAQSSDSAALSSAQTAGTRRSLTSSSGTAAGESRGAVDAAAARAVSSGLAAPAVLLGSGPVSVSIPMAQLPYAPAAKAQRQTSEAVRAQTTSLGLTNAVSLPNFAPSSSSGPSSSLDQVPKSVPSTAPRAPPGPAPHATPTVAPSSVPASDPPDTQSKSAASPVPSSGPNVNSKSAPSSFPDLAPSPIGLSDPSRAVSAPRAVPTLQAAAPILPKAGSDAIPRPLLRAASTSAPSPEPASAVLHGPPRPVHRQTLKPPLTLAEEYAVNPTKATLLKHRTALMDQLTACVSTVTNPEVKLMLQNMMQPAQGSAAAAAASDSSQSSEFESDSDSDSDSESTPGPSFPPAASNTPRVLPVLHSAREGSDPHTHSASQHATEQVLDGVRSRPGPPHARLPNQAWKSADQLHSPGSSAFPLPKQATAPGASQTTAAPAMQTAASVPDQGTGAEPEQAIAVMAEQTTHVLPKQAAAAAAAGLTSGAKQKKQGSLVRAASLGPAATAQFGGNEKKRKGSASMHDAFLPPVLVQTKAASKRQKQGSVQTGRQFESIQMADNSPMGPVIGPQQSDATARSPASGPGAAANSPSDRHLLGTKADTSSLRASAQSPGAVGHNVLLSQASSPLGSGAVRCGPRTARCRADPVSPRADADGPKAAALGPAAAAELSLPLAIRQEEPATNPGALVHPWVASSSPTLMSSGPASPVVPGPRSAEGNALAVAPVAPNSMDWTPADVHEMMSRLVFQTNTHNVFRCSEPDGYELLAVLPGMSIDDISVNCQPDGSMDIYASPKPLEQMVWPIRPMHIHTRMPGPVIPSSASAQFTMDARLFVRVNSA